jgi:hypothetical protein
VCKDQSLWREKLLLSILLQYKLQYQGLVYVVDTTSNVNKQECVTGGERDRKAKKTEKLRDVEEMRGHKEKYGEREGARQGGMINHWYLF